MGRHLSQIFSGGLEGSMNDFGNPSRASKRVLGLLKRGGGVRSPSEGPRGTGEPAGP